MAFLKHGNFKMKCNLDEMLQRQFYFFGTYFMEDEILACWEKFACYSDMIFDVGANAGIFSLAALAMREDAVVHAFEPTPEIAAHLRDTACLNHLERLYVHEFAVSDASGRAVLNRFRGENGYNGGMNYITADKGELTAERVDKITLDGFCRDRSIERIDLLKLDIQGHEHAALLGCTDMISTGRIKTIFMELNWAKTALEICPATRSIQLLERAGYRFSEPGRILTWRDAGDWLTKFSDVIASRSSR